MFKVKKKVVKKEEKNASEGGREGKEYFDR